jgi:hypothetical protein
VEAGKHLDIDMVLDESRLITAGWQTENSVDGRIVTESKYRGNLLGADVL